MAITINEFNLCQLVQDILRKTFGYRYNITDIEVPFSIPGKNSQKVLLFEVRDSENPGEDKLVFVAKHGDNVEREALNYARKRSLFPKNYPEIVYQPGQGFFEQHPNLLITKHVSGETEYMNFLLENADLVLGRSNGSKMEQIFKPKLEHIASIHKRSKPGNAFKEVDYTERIRRRLFSQLARYLGVNFSFEEEFLREHKLHIASNLDEAKQVEYIDAKLANWIGNVKLDEENGELLVPHMTIKSLLEYEVSFIPSQTLNELKRTYLLSLPEEERAEYLGLEDYSSVQFSLEKIGYCVRDITVIEGSVLFRGAVELDLRRQISQCQQAIGNLVDNAQLSRAYAMNFSLISRSIRQKLENDFNCLF